MPPQDKLDATIIVSKCNGGINVSAKKQWMPPLLLRTLVVAPRFLTMDATTTSRNSAVAYRTNLMPPLSSAKAMVASMIWAKTVDATTTLEDPSGGTTSIQ
jgi:hypothetical protein